MGVSVTAPRLGTSFPPATVGSTQPRPLLVTKSGALLVPQLVLYGKKKTKKPIHSFAKEANLHPGELLPHSFVSSLL